ncbi:MAG TPA: PAS domain-containing protein [Terriglobales bacterium]|nr:PAS domain-containing protein [Terriglobales bacterium]
MKLLTNPIFLKMVLVLFASGFAFFMAAVLMRRVRKSLGEDTSLPDTATSVDQLPLHTYHAVIQQLKQQKHELVALQQAEQRRAKTSESISAAVLSNLSSGVLFLGSNGLVRQANQAAKNILGIASPSGMDAGAIFRSACGPTSSLDGTTPTLAESVNTTLHEGIPLKRLAVEYLTPSGEHRMIEVTASRVPAADGTVLGVACLINDQTEISDIRRQIDLRGEMSAEMALALRTSLVTISGYAQQLALNHDPDLARQLATDIAAEAKHLDHTIGGFLAEDTKARAAKMNH